MFGLNEYHVTLYKMFINDKDFASATFTIVNENILKSSNIAIHTLDAGS